MNSEKKASTSINDDDEVSLIDIFLAVKRNSKLFFTIMLFGFLMSILTSYFKEQTNTPKETLSGSKDLITEYVIWVEIGKIYNINTNKNWIDDPKNTLAKIKNIYIPKLASELMSSSGSELNKSLISVRNPKKTQIIAIKIIKTSNKIDYNKVLMSLANSILENHNANLNLKNENAISIKPTRIIEGPTKVITKYKGKSNILNSVIGIIIGLFLGLFAVYIKEFLKKAKETELLS